METLRENIGYTQKRGWNSLKLTNKIFETCVLVQFHHFVVNRDVLSTFLLITWNCKWLQITKSPGLVLSVSMVKYCVIFSKRNRQAIFLQLVTNSPGVVLSVSMMSPSMSPSFSSHAVNFTLLFSPNPGIH